MTGRPMILAGESRLAEMRKSAQCNFLNAIDSEKADPSLSITGKVQYAVKLRSPLRIVIDLDGFNKTKLN